MSQLSSNHNLDIQNYSFHDIMELFELDIDHVTQEDLKKAKKRVLMIHPDKSKLPKEYFLFYKKAFDIVLNMYGNIQKVSQPVENQDYFPSNSVENEAQTAKMKNTLNKIKPDAFQKQFNEIFETQMKKPITNRNDWFSEESAIYNQNITNTSQMNSALEEIKQQQQHLVKYQGVMPIQSRAHVNSLYEEDNDEFDAEYVSSDIFSKLKYDDLRKVHKDQTVFAVSESDYRNVPKYRNTQEYERARSVANIQPIENEKAQQMMHEQEKILEQKMKHKQYKSELDSMRYNEANKQVMSNFLRLGN